MNVYRMGGHTDIAVQHKTIKSRPIAGVVTQTVQPSSVQYTTVQYRVRRHCKESQASNFASAPNDSSLADNASVSMPATALGRLRWSVVANFIKCARLLFSGVLQGCGGIAWGNRGFRSVTL